MDVNKLLTNIADFNLTNDAIENGFSSITSANMTKSICFDISTNRIGIGTVDPSYTIDIRGTSTDPKDIHIDKSNNDISYNVHESIDILFKLIKEIHNTPGIGITHNSANLDDNTVDYYNLYKDNKSS